MDWNHHQVRKRDNCGEKYFVKKKIKKIKSPGTVIGYVCDETTGRYYRRDVPRGTSGLGDSKKTASLEFTTSKEPVYRDHRQTNTSPIPLNRRRVRTPTTSAPLLRGDRLPGIVPIESEKQGKKDKIPDRVQWAKNCPVDWTSRVSASNINLVLWAWSFVAEILATRTGMAPNLETGELEARLQHFCHVLEITMQTSTLADFGGDSWAVARLYDRKVQQKVDSRMFSWVQLAEINHGASMPHELIAATQELAKKPKATGNGKFGDGNGRPGEGYGRSGDGKKKGGGAKEQQGVANRSNYKCPSWNISETRGKCRWELDFAPEKCNRVHECTWCKTKNLTPLDHQRSFCRKRLDDEG